MVQHWPPIQTLRGFEAAARLGSFHKAAAELNLTQSAISQQIRSLEAHLEQPLFFREGRRVTLTDAGHDLLGTAQSLLRQLAAGIRRLDQYRKPNQLVVNTTAAFARHWLTPRLGDFHRLHPETDLWLLTTEAAPDMSAETIDVAVRDDIGAQAQCDHRLLVEDRLYPACHPNVLAQAPAARTTLHGEREMDWAHWQAQGGVDVGQQRRGLNFSDPGVLLDAASRGLGIALVSELLAGEARGEGLLTPLTEQRVRGPNWAWLVHRDSERDPMTRRFCTWLEEAIRAAAT